jgi:cbb3-type cytochrome oxidase cytochrome c subunit
VPYNTPPGPRVMGPTKTWVVQHFANPLALSPGNIMPPYRFSSQEMDHLVAYLLILPD